MNEVVLLSNKYISKESFLNEIIIEGYHLELGGDNDQLWLIANDVEKCEVVINLIFQDEKGNVIGEVKSSLTIEDSKKACQLLENAGLINWMTLNQQNNFYKLGEKVVIAGNVEGLEGSFVEIEEYPSISHLNEDEKFNELSSFVDSLEMKHGEDYSCKKIYMLYTQTKKEKER